MPDSEYVLVEPPKLLVAPGDIHFPLQDNKALRLMTAVVEGVADQLALSREDLELVSTGDTFNTAGFSPHPSVRRSVHRDGGSLQAEINAATPWFNTWRSTFGKIRLLCGNHEAWQESSLALEGGNWWDVYGTTLAGCEVYPEGTRLHYGRLVVAHGHDLRGSLAKHSAATVLGEYPGQNTLYGHTHRLQACTTPTTRNGRLVAQGAWTVGMMADRAKERRDRGMRKFTDRHQQGFGLVYFFPSGLFKVELCEIFQRGRRYYTHAAGREYRI